MTKNSTLLLLCVAMPILLLTGASVHAVPSTHAAVKAHPGAGKRNKVIHSPYARAAGAHSVAPTPGNPIKGHSATAVQGLGTSALRKHTVGRPH